MLEDLFSKYMNEDYVTFQLPILDSVPQEFTHRFNDGRVLIVKIRYNKSFENWIIDFYQEGETQIPLALGIELNYGLDLLSSFKYKDLGEFYVFPKTSKMLDAPTYDDLNTNFYYIWRHN